MTFKTYEDAKRRFFERFDVNEQIGDLTKAQMQDWKMFLKTGIQQCRSDVQGFSTSTVAGTIAKAKAVFNWAVRNDWMDASPLKGVGRGSYFYCVI